MVEGQRRLVLDAAQHEAGAHPGHPGDVGQLVQQEVLVVLHVPHHHLELVVGVVAGDEVAFEHLWQILDGPIEVFEPLRGVPVHGDVNVGGEGEPQLAGVEQGDVGIDETGILQRLDPARAGRGGEPDQFGQLQVADAAILLHQLQNMPVYAIKFQHSPFLVAIINSLFLD
ncbi:hypothetical protein D3C85_1201670 [compost metagenome]